MATGTEVQSTLCSITFAFCNYFVTQVNIENGKMSHVTGVETHERTPLRQQTYKIGGDVEDDTTDRVQ